MTQTRLTLLERLGRGGEEAKSTWNEFVNIYRPLIVRYARRRGASEDEVEDVAQEVLRVVTTRIATFQHAGRQGSFRAWLNRITARTVAQNLLDRQRGPDVVGGKTGVDLIARLPDPAASRDEIWEEEWRKRRLQVAMEAARGQVEPLTWQVFELCVLQDMAPADVAQQLQISKGKVYVYKSRVTHRIRQIARNLED